MKQTVLTIGMPAGSLADPKRGGNLVQLLDAAGFQTSGYESGGPTRFPDINYYYGWDGRPQEFGAQLSINELDVVICRGDTFYPPYPFYILVGRCGIKELADTCSCLGEDLCPRYADITANFNTADPELLGIGSSINVSLTKNKGKTEGNNGHAQHNTEFHYRSFLNSHINS